MSPVRRWLWGIGAVVVVLAVVVGVVLATRDDGDNSATTTTSTTTVSSSTTVPASTTSPSSSTTTGPTTTTTTSGLPVLTDDPQTYAQYLFAAWQQGNQTAAAKVASADAVTQMFAQAYPAQGPYTFSRCGPAAGSLYCTWNGQNGATILIQVRTLTGGLPIQVEMVQFSS